MMTVAYIEKFYSLLSKLAILLFYYHLFSHSGFFLQANYKIYKIYPKNKLTVLILKKLYVDQNLILQGGGCRLTPPLLSYGPAIYIYSISLILEVIYLRNKSLAQASLECKFCRIIHFKDLHNHSVREHFKILTNFLITSFSCALGRDFKKLTFLQSFCI